MENKMSKEHVAKLMKQLDELKRKKAEKEKKLQKLKVCHIKDRKNGKTASINTSDGKTSPQASISKKNIKHLSLKKTSENSIVLDKDSHKSFDSNFTEPDDNQMKINKQSHAYRKVDLLHFEDHNVNETAAGEMKVPKQNEFSIENKEYNKNPTVNKTGILEVCDLSSNHIFATDTYQKSFNNTVFLKPHGNQVEIVGFLSKKHKPSLLNEDDKVTHNDEKPHTDIQNWKLNEIINQTGEIDTNPIQDFRIKRKELSVKSEAVSVLAPVTINDCEFSSFQGEQKSSNSSKKSSLGSKNKSSDILDDSLNEKMSFLCSDLFDNDYNDRKETVNNCDINPAPINNGVESPKQLENMIKEIVPDHKTTSSISCNRLSNGSPQNFNFPKFSTPTDMCLSDDAIISQSNEKENVHSLTKGIGTEKSNCIKNKSFISENKNLLNDEVKENVYSQNKFDPSHISYIIGKGLSSVLDAHYESPKKNPPEYKLFSNATCVNKNIFKDITGETVFKKRKLFENDVSEPESKIKKLDRLSQNLELNVKSNSDTSFENIAETDKPIIDLEFVNTETFCANSGSFSDLQNSSDKVTLADNSCNNVPSQVSKAVDRLVTEVCENSLLPKQVNAEVELVTQKMKNNNMLEENMKIDSEIQVIPETEGLGLDFLKDSEDFLEVSSSQNLKDLNANENFLNMSSQSKLKSPEVNNIESIETPISCDHKDYDETEENKTNLFVRTEQDQTNRKMTKDAASAFDNTLDLDTSFLDDDTQDLGQLKQVPYMNTENVQESKKHTTEKISTPTESNLNFTCSLNGTIDEPVIDVEVILYGGVKYAFIQHTTQIHVWRQEKRKGWIKIFNHHIEDMLTLVKICVTMDEDNLVIVMLLSDDEKYCLQFLLFEKNTRIIKLMENTHWLEERYLKDSIFLCGLNGLMFATAQNKDNPEVSIHAFISLNENPRLMTAVLGSTDSKLCSLCKIDKLPNALMGVGDSMLYIWHILEARLVTAVPLHPYNYLPIKQCFWATVENGLIYFLTTCEGKESHQVCQLLAANLATGFCQSAMTYSTRPSNNKVKKIIKATYLEPFLVVAHSNGAFVWSVTEEYCCAAHTSKSNITTIAISKDFENWGLIALGSKFGSIDCYSIH